jgi:hypothetical protein
MSAAAGMTAWAAPSAADEHVAAPVIAADPAHAAGSASC